MDPALINFGEKVDFYRVSATDIAEYLSQCHVGELGGISAEQFVVAAQNLQKGADAILIVRRNRSISKGTGTLLSPDDRQLVNSFPDQTVLALYRLNGERDKGWKGNPFWVPNIKLPGRMMVYYRD